MELVYLREYGLTCKLAALHFRLYFLKECICESFKVSFFIVSTASRCSADLLDESLLFSFDILKQLASI